MILQVFRLVLLAASVFVVSSVKAHPRSEIQARDLSGVSCVELDYGADQIKVGVGPLCASISGGNLNIAFPDLTGSDFTYTEIHAYADTAPPTNRAPGLFPYSTDNNFCSTIAAEKLAFCVIPIKPEWQDCSGTLFVAAYAAITSPTLGSQGAWGAGQCFGNGNGNCAKYFSVQLTCQ